jgi:membrane protease YdiL (CAAX protease family)
MWSTTITLLWTLLAAGVVLWLFERRSWTELRLVVPHGWRMMATIGLLSAVALYYARSVDTIARARRLKKRIKFPKGVERRAPHTQTELAWFMAVSVSAGVCEEFIFRGYLIWLLQSVLGLWGAAAVSLVVFMAAHAYQGAKGVVGVGLVGALLTVVVLVFGSLVAAIAMHVLIDAGEGFVAWFALREVQPSRDRQSGLGEPLLTEHVASDGTNQ